jgi:hypothetical protein
VSPATPEESPDTRGTASLPLQVWQRMDWQFLLPPTEYGTVACAGAVDHELARGLALLGGAVHHVRSATDWRSLAGSCSLVVLARPQPEDIDAALSALRPGGWLYAEITRGSPFSRGPRTLSGWLRALRRTGLQEVAAHWHIPDIATSSRIVPFDAPVVIRDALLRLRSRRFGTAISAAARLAQRLGTLPLLAREGSVVGCLPGGSR